MSIKVRVIIKIISKITTNILEINMAFKLVNKKIKVSESVFDKIEL